MDFPGWTIIKRDFYEQGVWENEPAWHMELILMRVADGALRQKTLHALVNPLQPGEPVPWETRDWAPVPLTEDAANQLLAMDLAGLGEDEDTQPFELPQRVISGCASFLLDEGEEWGQLYSWPSALAGVVVNAEGKECVRVACWNGETYDSPTSSRFFEEPCFYIDGYASWEDTIAVALEGCNPEFVRQEDGRWLFSGLADGNWTLYHVYPDFVTDAIFDALSDSNDVLHYGQPAFEMDLTTADLPAIPDYIRDVIPLLDSSAYACVRADGTPMLSGPGGETTAVCYARLTGRILQRENGYVCLRFGSEDRGLTGWFAGEDLAYGPEIEGVRCGFPSHSADDCDGEYLAAVLEGVDLAGLEDYFCMVWLVGRLPDGGWLVQLDVDTLCTAPADAFHGIGPAAEHWAAFEAEYDEFEQEMLEWASWAEEEDD